MQFTIHSLPIPVNQKYLNRQYVLRPEYRQWRDEVASHVPGGHVVFTRPVSLQVDFYVHRDRDIDSGLKCLLDGMNGCVYVDDKLIEELQVTKNRVESVEEVMTVVRIENLTPP